MKVHALNVESLRTHFEMYTAAMHNRSPLTRAEREMVATDVSRLNGCAYCVAHHSRGLKRLLPADRRDAADDLKEGRLERLNDREKALVLYARKLTSTPQQMNEGDVKALRDVGLDDRTILDLAQCIGYFNYVNRIVLGLGVTLGEGESEPGQWPE